jgi:hypothetical protein
VTKKLFSQSQLYNDFAATELRMNLDLVPLWRGNDVAIKQLREDLAKYLYLPKLIIPDLLRASIENGVNLISWQKDSFAYAESFDEENKRYRGLRAGSQVGISLEGNGIVVKPEIAAAQLLIEKSEAEEKTKGDDILPNASNQPVTKTDNYGNIQKPTQNTRFFGHLETDATRFFRATDDIEKEILKHLNNIRGLKVKITIHIDAENKDGFSSDIERTLRENGKTLGFGNVDFEE